MNPVEQLAQLHWYKTGFANAQAEADYRQWRIARTLSLAKLAGGVSLPVWLITPAIWHALGIQMTWFDIALVYGLIVPGMAMGLFIERTPFLRWGPEYALVVLVLAGAQFSFRSSYVLYESLSLMALGSVLFAMFAPLMRLPIKHTFIAVSLLLLPAALLIGFAVLGHKTPATAELTFILSMLAITTFLVLVMTFANEVFLRRSYLHELTMNKQQAAIRRYLPGAVAQHILSGQEQAIAQPQRRRVTIVFADISGFTDMADRVEPEVMTEVLSDHLSAMTRIIESHGGTLNEFAGDGLMALFGAPDSLPPEQQVTKAIAAAQAMQAHMPVLNQSWRKLGLGTQLSIRIGMNTGMVSVGSYGSDGRMTYTAIGLQTNIASRIESAAEPGKILLSEASYCLLDDSSKMRACGEVSCKGVHYPIKVYGLKDVVD